MAPSNLSISMMRCNLLLCELNDIFYNFYLLYLDFTIFVCCI